MQEEAGMKIKFRSGQGFHIGSQLAVKYNPKWLSKVELSFRYTRNNADFTYDVSSASQLQSFDIAHFRCNATLLPLGYRLLKPGAYSLTGTLGGGVNYLAGSSGDERWSSNLFIPISGYDFWGDQQISFFYAAQIQAEYRHWHIAAILNWQSRLFDNKHMFKVDYMKDGYCGFNYQTLDLRIGYQF